MTSFIEAEAADWPGTGTRVPASSGRGLGRDRAAEYS
jgi:hypothetical protein